MLQRYFVMFLALTAVLVGVQIPNFVTQYEQRLDAQLSEAMVYYREYQRIADTYLDGDMQALIELHETNDNPVFREEAIPIRTLIERVELFRFEQQQLAKGYLAKLWFIATAANPQLRADTWRVYSFNVPLTQQAVFTGVVFALLAALLFDGCVGGCRFIYRRFRRSSLDTHLQ